MARTTIDDATVSGPPGTGTAWSANVRGAQIASGTQYWFWGVGPWNDATRDWVGAQPAAEQFTRCMTNLTALLTGAGLALTDVIAVWLHISRLDDLGAVDLVWATAWGTSGPARILVNGPNKEGVKIELDVLAVKTPAE